MDRYISIRVILDDLLEHPLLQDLTLERVINYTVEFIRILGAPKMYNNKVVELKLEDYRAQLPCDFHRIIQLRFKDHNTFVALRSTTDSFHLSEHKDNIGDITYKIQGQVIFASIKEGTLELSYEAIPVDDEGYPLIPDNSSFIKALEAYITKKKFRILFDMNKITPAVYNNASREYYLAAAQAHSSLIMPTIDEMESITNMWNTLIPRVTEHSYGFKNNGAKEFLKRQ